jgi:hypothetical protein
MSAIYPWPLHVDRCSLGGCPRKAINAGLFCARHWGMTTAATQRAFCELVLDGQRPIEAKQAEITAIELTGLDEIARYLKSTKESKGKKK